MFNKMLQDPPRQPVSSGWSYLSSSSLLSSYLSFHASLSHLYYLSPSLKRENMKLST